MSSGAQLVPAAFTGCAPRKLLILSLYGHTVVPRLKTVESHVIVPTSTPSNVARALKRRSTSTPFPVMADGFGGMEMNQRNSEVGPPPPSRVAAPCPSSVIRSVLMLTRSTQVPVTRMVSPGWALAKTSAMFCPRSQFTTLMLEPASPVRDLKGTAATSASGMRSGRINIFLKSVDSFLFLSFVD